MTTRSTTSAAAKAPVADPVAAPSRRQLIFGALAATLPLHSHSFDLMDSARRLAGQVPCLRIGLVDVSTSLGDTAAADARALRALKAFFGKAQAGDELIVGSIGEARMDRVRMQSSSVRRSGKMFEDKKRLAQALDDQLAWAKTELARTRTPATRCVETLAAHQAAIMRALQEGCTVQVLLASDAVESSDWCQFEDPRQLNARTLPKLVDDLAARRMLLRDTSAHSAKPDQVQMMVVGAGGSNSSSWQVIRAFWEAYCAKAGVQLVHYGPDLPPFL